MGKIIRTCEFVSPQHPDKLCDLIADSILEAYLKKDKTSRVAVEVMAGHGQVTISGEVTSQAQVDLESIVKKIVGDNYQVHKYLVEQSPFIAQGVDMGGAGDQGIMVGYACRETENFMPLEYDLARRLCQIIYEIYPFDGKVQVTLEDKVVKVVVASWQNVQQEVLEKLVKQFIKADKYLINPAGDWTMGGLEADSGLSGRKIVIDAYGPRVAVGGGSFSGKDYTKVDRSGAYMARKIAVGLLKKYNAQEVIVDLAYAIGVKEPVMAEAVVDNKIIIFKDYDLSPQGIRKQLSLDDFAFTKTSSWGHFGQSFEWDK